jgi:cyclic-di-GMP-binding protein
MPSFDVVSEVNQHELTNAVDQANREIENRFDFKGTGASFELSNDDIELKAPSEFQVKQMQPILESKLIKREIDIQCLDWQEIETNLSQGRQKVIVKQGVDKEMAKKLIKLIKDSKIKVQTAIQGEQVRVTGKKRDDLQQVISMLRESNLNFPLQYTNFRD